MKTTHEHRHFAAIGPGDLGRHTGSRIAGNDGAGSGTVAGAGAGDAAAGRRSRRSRITQDPAIKQEPAARTTVTGSNIARVRKEPRPAVGGAGPDVHRPDRRDDPPRGARDSSPDPDPGTLIGAVPRSASSDPDPLGPAAALSVCADPFSILKPDPRGPRSPCPSPRGPQPNQGFKPRRSSGLTGLQQLCPRRCNNVAFSLQSETPPLYLRSVSPAGELYSELFHLGVIT